jgi:hypothetical protein
VKDVHEDLRLVGFDGFGDEYDVWLHLDSGRLAAKNTHTKGNTSGPGAGILVPPPVGTRVELNPEVIDGRVVYHLGRVVRNGADFFAAQIDDGSKPEVVIKQPVPWGHVRYPHVVNTPSAEDIADGNIKPAQNVDAQDEFFTMYVSEARLSPTPLSIWQLRANA